MRIVLIGPRGSGKTTVGRALAERLGVPLIDLDDRVLESFDEPSVTAVWAAHGEPAWRQREARELAAVLERTVETMVLALGGGAPMLEAVRAALQAEQAAERAKVVYLRATPRVLAERLADQPGDRPSLTGGVVDQEVEDVLRKREPTYRALADVVVETADRGVEATVEAIVEGMGADERAGQQGD